MGPNVTSELALQLRLREQQVQSTLDLLRQGNTVPFMARFCKEITGGLNRKTITAMVELRDRLAALGARKKAILETIREQGKLTVELERAINLASQPWLLEDLYLPFRSQRHTAAMLARDRGLEPLAELILSGQGETQIEDAAERRQQGCIFDDGPRSGSVGIGHRGDPRPLPPTVSRLRVGHTGGRLAIHLKVAQNSCIMWS